ncbi:hypothetical protein [Kitasatospora sp. KL5]|uniref:hypothetical protein n=1 Tax=Kitasatospora sp. KL5 TaxID=3425125 RepID=UPI003D6EAB94
MADSAVGALAQAIGDAVGSVIEAFATLWVKVPSSQIEGSPAVASINGSIYWITMAVAIGSVMAAGTKMALDRQGESLQTLLKGLGRLVLVAFAGPFAVQLFSDASDAVTSDLIGQAKLGDDVKKALGAMVATNPGLVIVFGILVLVASLIQVMLMIVRMGVLIMLVGTLPLAASASMTGWGGDWWKRHTGWLIAWLLYKPAAALIIFSGATMTSSDNKLLTQIAGMAMLVLAVFTLPAMLKLVVPATAAMGGASGGGIALAAGTALASGAVQLAAAGATGGASAAATSGSMQMSSLSASMSGPTGSSAGGGDPGGGGGGSGGGMLAIASSAGGGDPGGGGGDSGGGGGGGGDQGGGGGGSPPGGGMTTATITATTMSAEWSSTPAQGSRPAGGNQTTGGTVAMDTLRAAGGAAQDALGDTDQVT